MLDYTQDRIKIPGMSVHRHDPNVLLVHVHTYKFDLCGKGTPSGICRVPPERKGIKKKRAGQGEYRTH